MMTVEERANLAAELKASGQCNCCQAVLRALEDKLPMNSQTNYMLASGFAVGMGCMEATCGALIGAVMAAGFLTNGQGSVRAAKATALKFKEMCGAFICKELKGVGTGKVLCDCPDCCKNAVLALEPLL